VVGDIALLEPGGIVRCDRVFLSGHDGKCDESDATAESDAINKVSDGAQRGGHKGEVETGEIRVDELASDISGTTIFYPNQILQTISLCYRDFDSWPPPSTKAPAEDEVRVVYNSESIGLLIWFEFQAANDDLACDLMLINWPIKHSLRVGVRQAVAKCHMAGVTAGIFDVKHEGLPFLI